MYNYTTSLLYKAATISHSHDPTLSNQKQPPSVSPAHVPPMLRLRYRPELTEHNKKISQHPHSRIGPALR